MFFFITPLAQQYSFLLKKRQTSCNNPLLLGVLHSVKIIHYLNTTFGYRISRRYPYPLLETIGVLNILVTVE